MKRVVRPPAKRVPLVIKVRNRIKTPATVRLKEMTQAPEQDGDYLFKPPIKPAQVFHSFERYLTPQETSEIIQYREIWYLRMVPPQSKLFSSVKVPEFFPFVKDDHIAYRYQQLEVLGKGSFGSVIKCLDHKTNDLVAVKMLRDSPKVHSQILFELDLLKQLQCPEGHRIIKYVDNFVFRGFFCIVMELVSDDLYTSLKRRRFTAFRMPTIQMIVKETAEALDHMHNCGIIHCDIKPENILFTSEEQKGVKVIDFGCSCYIGRILFTYIQSRYYRAPEVVFGMQYSKQIDIWSLGCVICELITGQPLFPAEDEDELMQMMVATLGMPPKSMILNAPRAHHYFDAKGQLKQKPNSKGKVYLPNSTTIAEATGICDPALISILEGCLKWQPMERPTAKELMMNTWCKSREESVPKSARL